MLLGQQALTCNLAMHKMPHHFIEIQHCFLPPCVQENMVATWSCYRYDHFYSGMGMVEKWNGGMAE